MSIKITVANGHNSDRMGRKKGGRAMTYCETYESALYLQLVCKTYTIWYLLIRCVYRGI